jgi:hypothetical protein
MKANWLLQEKRNTCGLLDQKNLRISMAPPSVIWSDLLFSISENSTAGDYKSWQIRQADQAVRRYFSNLNHFA